MSTQVFDTAKEIQKIAGEYKDSPERLMEILLEIQKHTSNCFDREMMEIVSVATGIPESKLYDYTTFYAMFSTKKRGKYLIRMCKSAPCHVCGAKDVAETICETLGVQPGETTKDGMFTVEFCECIGLCESSPSVMINDKPYSNLTPERIRDILVQYRKGVEV